MQFFHTASLQLARVFGICALSLISSATLAETALESVDIESTLKPTLQNNSTSTLDTYASEINLTIEELQGTAGSQGDPLKAITSLPGIVNATSGAGLSSGFYIRGSNTNDNALWIDDLPVGYVFHLDGLYSILNPDLITNFDTYLGGFGVALGDRLGGAINVKTKVPKRDKTEQSVQVGFYDSSYRVEGPLTQNSSGYFAIRRSYLDLLLPATGELGDSRVNYTEFPRFWDMQAKLHTQLKDGFVDLTLFAAQDNLTLNIENEGDILQDPALAGLLGGEEAFQTLGARWHKRLTPNVEQKLRFGLLQTQSDRFVGTQLVGDPEPGQPFNQNINSANWFFLPQWHYQPDNNAWLFGVDSYNYQYDIDGYFFQACHEGQPDCNLTRLPKALLDEQVNGWEVSPYVEYQHQLTDDINISLGFRHTNMTLGDVERSSLSPRLGLEYLLSDKVILTANWGKYLQRPQITELTQTLGNPGLALTEAEHRIIGAKIELSSTWSAQIEAYHKPMISLIVPEDAPDYYSNSGSGEASGLDIFLKRKWQDGRFGWVSYSYATSERTDGDGSPSRPFDGDQPHTLSFVWHQPMTGDWTNWSWGAKLNAHTGQPYTPVIDREGLVVPGSGQTALACSSNGSLAGCYWSPIYDDTNSDRLPIYFKMDLAMERDWHYRDLKLTTRFEMLNINALFRQNVIGYIYNSDYSEIDEVYELPFLPSFSVRGTF